MTRTSPQGGILRSPGGAATHATARTDSATVPGMDEQSRLKRTAAGRAVDLLQSGMTVGLGAGSTAEFALRRLGDLVASRRLTDIVGVPCSRQVADQALRLGITPSTLDDQVEVVEFGWPAQAHYLESLDARMQLRLNEEGVPFRTDEGHLILLDCAFGPIQRPGDLAALLEARAGVVEHGIFLRIATDVLVGTIDGVRHLSRNGQAAQR